jgi:hypothetical protein
MSSKEEPNSSREGKRVNLVHLTDILVAKERTGSIETIPVGFESELNPYTTPFLEAAGYSGNSAFGQFIFLTAATHLLAGYIVGEIRRGTITRGRDRGDLTLPAKRKVVALQALQADLHRARRTIGGEIFGDRADEYAEMVNILFKRPPGDQEKKGIEEKKLLTKNSVQM